MAMYRLGWTRPHASNRRQRRPRLHGFTLVELLVVLAVLSLLLALLLPAMRRAQEAARTAACASNQRSIGVALFTYAADHTGWLPVCYYQGLNNVCNPFFGDMVYFDPYNPDPPWNQEPAAPASDRSSDALINLGGLWKEDLIGQGEVLYCPSQPDDGRQHDRYADPAWPTEETVPWARGGKIIPGFSYNSEPAETDVIWQKVHRKYQRVAQLDDDAVLVSDVLSINAIAHPGPGINVLWRGGSVSHVVPDDIESELSKLDAWNHNGGKMKFEVIPEVLDELQEARQ